MAQQRSMLKIIPNIWDGEMDGERERDKG